MARAARAASTSSKVAGGPRQSQMQIRVYEKERRAYRAAARAAGLSMSAWVRLRLKDAIENPMNRWRNGGRG